MLTCTRGDHHPSRYDCCWPVNPLQHLLRWSTCPVARVTCKRLTLKELLVAAARNPLVTVSRTTGSAAETLWAPYVSCFVFDQPYCICCSHLQYVRSFLSTLAVRCSTRLRVHVASSAGGRHQHSMRTNETIHRDRTSPTRRLTLIKMPSQLSALCAYTCC